MTVKPERVNHMGVVLEIDHAVMAPRIVETIKRGTYERAEARIVKTLIQDDDVVLELGAGVGFVTTVIAADPRVAKLVSYEPDAQLAAAARKTLLLNGVSIEGRVEIRNAVVSHSIETPTTMFYVHNEFWMSGLKPYNTVARIDEVRVDRLNEVLKELQPSVIVCDIEGEEKDLFNDADLNSVARILIEIHQYRIGDSGVVNLFNALHARGFCYDQYRSEKAVVCFYRTVS